MGNESKSVCKKAKIFACQVHGICTTTYNTKCMEDVKAAPRAFMQRGVCVGGGGGGSVSLLKPGFCVREIQCDV